MIAYASTVEYRDKIQKEQWIDISVGGGRVAPFIMASFTGGTVTATHNQQVIVNLQKRERCHDILFFFRML